jgi:UDP-hydrolysing UDP-N-acetyl-D-glucosamine 2-epimerase
MRRILALLVDRANYGRLKPVLLELERHSDIDLSIMVAGTMPLERFGEAERVVSQDGFRIDARVYMELEGGNPVTMAKSLGLGIIEFASVLQRLRPEALLVIGDRYEALGAVTAAAFMNICVIHLQGGEVSGSIDESTRHAISKYAHYHFPATKRSADYLVRMGENPSMVFYEGCPSADLAALATESLPKDAFDSGVGAHVDPHQDYLLVIHHPVTTDFGTPIEQEVRDLLSVLETIGMPTIWLWPNIDAGTERIAKELRKYRESHNNNWLRLVKNFPPDLFLKVLKNARCAVGNSSSFVRDSTFFGTPVVLVGNRQVGREYGENLINVSGGKQEIEHAIKKQLSVGRYVPSELYGKPGVSKKIAQKIAQLSEIHKKTLHYVYEKA